MGCATNLELHLPGLQDVATVLAEVDIDADTAVMVVFGCHDERPTCIARESTVYSAKEGLSLGRDVV